MEELEQLLASKIEQRGQLNMEIFSIQEVLRMMKESKDSN